jgi:hypothetical protein
MIPRNEGPGNISALFNKFAGREVLAPTAMGIDPTIQEMKKLADDNGLRLRVLFPGMMKTMDHCPDRIIVHIEEGMDGKYRVGKRFSVG